MNKMFPNFLEIEIVMTAE